MANGKVCFIRKNVKDFQLSKKRLKRIECLKHKIESNRALFLQERHSVSDEENAWADDFEGQVFFFMVHIAPVVMRNNLLLYKNILLILYNKD